MRTLLIGEDDRHLRDEYVAWLREEPDAHVLAAASGLEALELAREHKPALAVLNCDLPWLDGWQVARMLREDAETRLIRIVALVEPGTPKVQYATADAWVRAPARQSALIAAVRKFGLPESGTFQVAAPVRRSLWPFRIRRQG